jgi:hypothetical protein
MRFSVSNIVSRKRPAYRFFALEIDRGTMPVARSNAAQTSHAGKLALYEEIVCARGHKRLLGIPNLFVLTITTSSARLSNLLAATNPSPSSPWFLFKAVDESVLREPLPLLLSEPWQRAGLPALSIAVPE